MALSNFSCVGVVVKLIFSDECLIATVFSSDPALNRPEPGIVPPFLLQSISSGVMEIII